MNQDDIKIPKPCSVDWSGMTGDDRKRFCGQCSKHVHNLSEMTEHTARAVIQQPNVCVRYTADRNGTIRFRPRRRSLRRGAIIGGIFMLSLPAAATMASTDVDENCERPGLFQQLWNRITLSAPPAPPSDVHPMMGEIDSRMFSETPPEPELQAPELLLTKQGEVAAPSEAEDIAPEEEEE